LYSAQTFTAALSRVMTFDGNYRSGHRRGAYITDCSDSQEKYKEDSGKIIKWGKIALNVAPID
jgi:hypothetical protein